MKKKFVLVILFIVLLLTSVNISAAKGGKYTFEEGNLKITVPSNYIVFTRDTTSKDADLKKYGIDFDQMKEQFESGNIYADMITDKKSEIAVIIYADSSSSDIPNLTEYLKKYPDEFDKMKLGSNIADFTNAGFEISSMTLYKNSSYYYIHFEGYNSISKNYAEMYITTINGKYVAFSTKPLTDTKITSAQKTALKNFVDKDISFYDVQPLPASSRLNNKSPADAFTTGAVTVLIISAVGGIIAFIRRKIDAACEPKYTENKLRKERDKKLGIIQNAIENCNLDIEKNKKILTEEEKQNPVQTLGKWISDTDESFNNESVEKGYALLYYFKEKDSLEYAQQLAEKLMEISRKRNGNWTIIDDALTLNTNYIANQEEKMNFASGNLENKYEKWLLIDNNNIKKIDIKLGYFLLNYFRYTSPSKSEKVAKKLIEINKIYNIKVEEQIKIIKKAKSYNTFNDLSFFEVDINKELNRWDELGSYMIYGKELKIGFILLDYCIETDDLETGQRIADKLIKVCSEPSELFNKALTFYNYPQVDEKSKYKTYVTASIQLKKWMSISDDSLNTTDIQDGFLLLYYFQKQGYLNESKEIAIKLIKIMESRSDVVAKQHEIVDNNKVQEFASVLATEPQTDTDELEDNSDKTKDFNNDDFIFCRKCGTKLPKDSAFCKICGTKI